MQVIINQSAANTLLKTVDIPTIDANGFLWRNMCDLQEVIVHIYSLYHCLRVLRIASDSE